jgi:hypothetical protein
MRRCWHTFCHPARESQEKKFAEEFAERFAKEFATKFGQD